MERISLRLLFYLETINQTLAQVAHRDLETIFWLGKQLAQIVRTWECITGNISVHKLDNCVFHVFHYFLPTLICHPMVRNLQSLIYEALKAVHLCDSVIHCLCVRIAQCANRLSSQGFCSPFPSFKGKPTRSEQKWSAVWVNWEERTCFVHVTCSKNWS